jgi:uncharacterized protein
MGSFFVSFIKQIMGGHDMDAQEKYEKLQQILQNMQSVVIALSGGVDSTFLSYAAHLVLGGNAIAITAVSPTFPKREEKDAKKMAREIGIQHLLVQTAEFDNDDFVKNPQNRCYICKKIRFESLVKWAKENDYKWVIDGGNVDDLDDYRPGMKALQELDIVRSPMIEAGLQKKDIRQLSKYVGLSTWNKQSAACLASRFPYGIPLIPKKLAMVEQAEEFLIPLLQGGNLRVRYHDGGARIEVDQSNMNIVWENKDSIDQTLKQYGFHYVALDLAGYRMGSLNIIDT